MNIGIVVDNEFDNDHRVQKEIRLLLAEGHNISVLCFNFGKSYKSYEDFDVTRVKIPKKVRDLFVLLSTNFIFYRYLWQKNIAKFIDQNNLEALHVHDLYMSKAGRKGIDTSRHNIPLILDLHENYPAAINSYQWAIKGWRKFVVQPRKWYSKESTYLNYANAIIVLSEYFKTDLISRFPELKTKPIYTHPNMPDFESFKAFEQNEFTVNFQSNVTTLFYFGVVAKRRGIIDILPWIKELVEEGNKLHLLIIGPVDKADKNSFNGYLNSPVLKQCVTYIPWSDVKYLPAYLKKIAIGLAPFQVNKQHDSGVANKLFQYMYGQIPILATKCKAQQDLIETSDCGLLYEDQDDFKKQLVQLLENPKLRATLGKNGRKSLLELYSKKADKQFIKIYQDL
ncbi:glycosyltransferase [Seonamhaeicola sp. ML3]|uniref:glycosyltransferase n=1 Tax=Seonamhaeicola sp. ML3 TaxID=2937786 RepID=UPI0020106703|nr:glycosyltransferase [Seonamhaeicola sp. ML3]